MQASTTTVSPLCRNVHRRPVITVHAIHVSFVLNQRLNNANVAFRCREQQRRPVVIQHIRIRSFLKRRLRAIDVAVLCCFEKQIILDVLTHIKCFTWPFTALVATVDSHINFVVFDVHEMFVMFLMYIR
jgi:hypothetical protein